jgi:hypothetical protein
MEQRFSIKAKSLCFLSKEGSSLFWLEERRKKFVGYIFMNTQCSSWLIDTVEDIAKSIREGDKALMVYGGTNKAGRFLEVAVFAEGGRKGAVRLAGELRYMLASPLSRSEEPVFRSLPSSKPLPTKLARAGATADCSKDQSFAEVLLSKPHSKLEGRSRGEVKNGGIDLRIDEDSERSVWAAGSEGKMRGCAVKDWVSHLLGFVQLGLGQVVAGLLEGLLNGPEGISIRKRVRVVLKSLDGPMGFGVGPSPLHMSSRRVKSLRKAHFIPTRLRKGVGVGLKPKRETHLKRSRRVRSLASEISSLGAMLQAPKVRLGVSEDEPSVPERALGRDSGSVIERFSVPESPLHTVGSELALLPVVESCLGASDVGHPANEGSPSRAEPTPQLTVIPAFPLIPVTGVDSGALIEVSFEDGGENSAQGGGLRRLS